MTRRIYNICSTSLFTFACCATLFSRSLSAQEKFTPDPLELAPDGKVECSWGTMKKDEYQECLEKRAYFEKLSPDEKQSYNERVKKDQLEARVADLERRVEFLERTRR